MTFGSNSRLLPILALALALPGSSATFAAPPTTMAAAPTVETYEIDPAHSSVRFEISHLMFSTVPGGFTEFKGSLTLNPADVTRSRVEVVIKATSINTGTTPNDFDKDGKTKAMSPAARDNHLRSADFFDVANFPTITFTSTNVTETAPGNLQVSGTLNMHGVTKPVVIAVTGWGTGQGMKPGSFQAGFRKGTLKLKRSDFGITKMVGPIGDEVEITLSVEANKKVQPAS
jgi:polyisoprenoid-binding protein YceI